MSVKVEEREYGVSACVYNRCERVCKGVQEIETVSDSTNLGSNPSPPAINQTRRMAGFV